MKKPRNHSQLKEQENSPEGKNNKTDLCSLTHIWFKKEIVKILKEWRPNMKELRVDMNSNTDYIRNRKYKEEPRKIRKFICRDTNWAKGTKKKNE